LHIHALPFELSGTFVNSVSGKRIAGSLHQHPWLKSQVATLPQLLLL